MFNYIIKKLKNSRGNIGALFGGSSKDNQVANLKPPDFQVDPTYTQSQNTLADLGQNILKGNLPAYYSNIGMANSPAFKGMLNNIVGQTNQASQEQEALGGTGRSGVGAASSALALNNVIPGLTYNDFLNSQNQQVGLLNTGIGVEEGVRGAGQGQEGMVNNFALQQFQDQMDQAKYNNAFNMNAAKEQGSLLGTIGSIGLGALTGGMGFLPGVAGGLGGTLTGMIGGSGLGNSFGNLLKGINSAGGNNSGALDTTAPGFAQDFSKKLFNIS